MKKIFFKLTMLLFLLGMSVNAAWATNMSGMTDEQAKTLAFWARMTAKPATTTLGSGLVFVSEDEHPVEPGEGDYQSVHSAEGWSDIYLASSLISATVDFKVYAKANAGSYFTGWSFTDGYTDLGVGNGTYAAIKVNPSPKKGKANILDYTVYAAFEQVKLKSYSISGSNTMDPANPTCTQTVTFRAETPGFWALSSVDDVKHFKLPVITKKAGTAGTWATSITEWNTSNISFYGDYAEIRVPVTFTAPNGDPAEYGAELVLETEAGVKMKVYLSARTTGGDYEAVRYNKSKVQQETGSLSTLLENAEAGDIVKLNKDYASIVSVNKNITFDLNGYTLSNTLTVSGGNVTIAYSAFGGTANALNVTGGKAILNGGSFGSLYVADGATVEQNGATITGAATNNGSLTTTDGKFQGGLTSSKTLVVNGGTFNGSVAIDVTGGTADIKRGTISGSTYGVQTTGGSVTIGKLAAVTGTTKALYGNGGTLTVNNGKFTDPANLIAGAVTFKAGYFRTNNAGGATALGKQVWRNTSGVENREGYEFFVGDQEAAQASNVSVCRIGQTAYASLEDALAYANNSGKEVFIIMENDYVLSAGYYTLPANATLIVPMSNDQETANRVVPRSTDDIPAPVSFRKLTFASGVNMEVAGTLEVTCTQYGKGETMGVPSGNFGHLILKQGSHMTINNGGYLRAWGFVTGDGTKDGSGNYLSGEIDVRRGGTVHEMFQMGDWKGGDISFTIAMEVPGLTNWRDRAHLFPIYTYFIQNVESPVKYHPGASLICATSVNVSGSINAYANDIKVVGKQGEAAMFLMDEKADAENTWVRKYYDAKKDQQVYEVNSGAQLGSMVINLGEVPGSMFGASGTLDLVLDSRKFVLPLTNNFKIHLLSGYMEFTQSTSCLPGMEVEVDKEAEVAITKNNDETIVSGALYFYDADQWSFQNSQAKGYVGNSGKFGAIVRYSPTWDLGTNGATKKPNVRNINSPAAIGDAILNVHGTFRMGEGCAVYTTWAKDNTLMALDESEGATGGASVISSNEDAGTFIFDADAPAFDGIHMSGMNITGFGPNVIVNYDHNDYGITSPIAYPVKIPTVLNKSTPTPVFGIELCTPVKLKNGDGTFEETSTTTAGTSYCYMNDQWTTMQVAEDECFMKEIVGGQTTYYAKPAEYVAVNATWDGEKMVGNADHTFSDKDGAGRLFILAADCQWWEVEKKDNLYHCIHPNNDTYYYWDDDAYEWKEKRFTITWKNWDGTPIETVIDELGTTGSKYSVTYGTMAEFLGSNPTRANNIDSTYNFTGWKPALGPVTQDVTYTATYESQPRMYTIIFNNEGGTEIERQFLKHNAVPVCENTPTKVGHILQWDPAISPVIGDQTYTATWLEEPPTEWDVTFVNNAGGVLKDTYKVGVAEHPSYSGTPVKENADHSAYSSNEYTYTFWGWSAVIDGVAQRFAAGTELPCPTHATTYTAVYTEAQKTYTVTFKNGEDMLFEKTDYHYGDTPECPADKIPADESDAQYTYAYAWSPQIQTVMGNQTYQWTSTRTTNKYTVTLTSNLSGVCTFTGAGTYDYYNNEGKEPEDEGYVVPKTVTVSYDSEKYNFLGWEDGEENASRTIASLESDITLTANFTPIALSDHTVTTEQTWDVPADTEIKDLIITSDGAACGQLLNPENLTIRGEAIYRIQQTFAAGTWYAVAVPWRVNPATGIYGASSRLASGSQIYVIEFDGAAYANTGVTDDTYQYWHFLNETGGDMVPGKLYMIWLASGQSKLDFYKKAGAALQTRNLTVSTVSGSVGESFNNWNAISNPALYTADLSTGVTKYQTYDNNDAETYTLVDAATEDLIVAKPIFVQVTTPGTVYATVSSGSASAPYRTAPQVENESKFVVEISRNNKMADRLIIETADEKADEYVIGQDLAKFGVSSKVAQMWVDRYDAKLCVNVVEMENERAEYPLSIFAPADGEYTLSAVQRRGEMALYLTYNGEAIANLSESAYTLTLNRGTAFGYGLRISPKMPQVTTGVDELIINSKDATATKVLINNKVYIIRGEKVYTVDGQLVK